MFRSASEASLPLSVAVDDPFTQSGHRYLKIQDMKRHVVRLRHVAQQVALPARSERGVDDGGPACVEHCSCQTAQMAISSTSSVGCIEGLSDTRAAASQGIEPGQTLRSTSERTRIAPGVCIRVWVTVVLPNRTGRV